MECKITDYFKVATEEDLRKDALRKAALKPPKRAKPATQIKRPVGRPRKRTVDETECSGSSSTQGQLQSETCGSKEDGEPDPDSE